MQKIKLIFSLMYLVLCNSTIATALLNTNPKNIDITESVPIGGISQLISIKGNNSESPVLLYLHGGPGQSVMSKSEKLTGKLQEHFVVIHWDQRGSGKTAALNKSPEKMTLQLMQSDTEEMVRYLLQRFRQQQLYLVGHSWGTVLGFYMAQKHPELLNAYVAISPPVDTPESERIALSKLKKYFEQTNNQKALKQLKTVKIPNENIEQKIIQYRWQTEFDGEKVTDEQVEQAMPFFQDWEHKWATIADEVFKINLFKSMPSLECPIYFFVGRKDYQTNFSITKSYYEKLKAPVKEFFWFEKSAHNVPDTEPVLMQNIIIKQILNGED